MLYHLFIHLATTCRGKEGAMSDWTIFCLNITAWSLLGIAAHRCLQNGWITVKFAVPQGSLRTVCEGPSWVPGDLFSWENLYGWGHTRVFGHLWKARWDYLVGKGTYVTIAVKFSAYLIMIIIIVIDNYKYMICNYWYQKFVSEEVGKVKDVFWHCR